VNLKLDVEWEEMVMGSAGDSADKTVVLVYCRLSRNFSTARPTANVVRRQTALPWGLTFVLLIRLASSTFQ